MAHINPDLDWYASLSHKKGVRPRCPFASVHRCPRFYQSLSLLGHAGSTEIDAKEDKRLLEKWKKSDLWPVTREQATSIAGEPGNPFSFSNFCPEVAHDRFGFFASFLGCYADEIDREIAHKSLIKEGAFRGDWRWAWAYASPMHYTECPLYSPLDLDASRHGTRDSKTDAPGNFSQLVFRWIWTWKPFWKVVVLAIVIPVAIILTVWKLLPSQFQEMLLDFVLQPFR
jgi:hypothetical protein